MTNLERDSDGSIKTNFTLKDKHNLFQIDLGNFNPSRILEHGLFNNHRSVNYLKTCHLSPIRPIPNSFFPDKQNVQSIDFSSLQNLFYIPYMSSTQNSAPQIPDKSNESNSISPNSDFFNYQTLDSELNSIDSCFTLPELISNESKYIDPLKQFHSKPTETKLPFEWQKQEWWENHVKESHEQQMSNCQMQMENRPKHVKNDIHTTMEEDNYIKKFHQYIQKMYEFQVLHPNEFEEYMQNHPEQYTEYNIFFEYQEQTFSDQPQPSFQAIHSSSIDFIESIPSQQSSSNQISLTSNCSEEIKSVNSSSEISTEITDQKQNLSESTEINDSDDHSIETQSSQDEISENQYSQDQYSENQLSQDQNNEKPVSTDQYSENQLSQDHTDEN